MHFGREAYNASETLVYAMPKMTSFLSQNGPWSQLVSLKNIMLKPFVINKKLKESRRTSSLKTVLIAILFKVKTNYHAF